MTTTTKIAGTAVALLAASVQLRRSTVIAVGAYRIGRDVERLIGRPARHAHVFRLAYDIGRRDRLQSWDS